MTGPVLRRDRHTAAELQRFHDDGFVAFPGVLTDAASAAFRAELLGLHQTRNASGCADESAAAYCALTPEERLATHGGHMFGPLRNWDAKGPVGDALLDPPLVMGFLHAVMGENFNLCHSAMSITSRGHGPQPQGAKLLSHHQDAGAGIPDRLNSYRSQLEQSQRYTEQREDWYISCFYYVEGLQPGVSSLSIIPGSHKLPPNDHPDDLAARGAMLSGAEMHSRVAAMLDGHGLKPQVLDLPPGTLIIHNSMCYHGVQNMPSSGENSRELSSFLRFPSSRVVFPHTQWLIFGEKRIIITRLARFLGRSQRSQEIRSDQGETELRSRPIMPNRPRSVSLV